MPLIDPVLTERGRIVPAGAPRWSNHWKVYVSAIAAVLVTEGHALYTNIQQRAEVKAGLRETPDYRHRTFSECTWAVGGFHPDDLRTKGGDVPYGKWRRLAFELFFDTWFPEHIRTNGKKF